MVLICIWCTGIFAITPAHGQEKVIYDAGGKRDPFMPLIGVMTKAVDSLADVICIEDVKLQGLASDSTGRRTAIINGEMIKQGETVGRLTVKRISKDTVILMIDEEEYSINIYGETTR